MTLAAYAHAGQHADCGRCDTWRCDACVHDAHAFCTYEPCTCDNEEHDLRAGETP